MKIISHKESIEGTGEITREYAEKTFDELLAFQGYGFCLGYDTEVYVKGIGKVAIGKLKGGEYIKAPALGKDYKWVKVTHIIPMGYKKVCHLVFSNGTEIFCTRDHKFLCSDNNKHSVDEIIKSIFSPFSEDIFSFVFDGNKQYSLISCKDIDEEMPVMDITVDSDEHLFYANGIATSNCKAHATSYSVYSAVQMWLQEHFFLEYMATLLTHVDRAKEKKGVKMLDERVKYCLRHGTSIFYPDVNMSGKRWEIKGGGLLAPLSNIKNFGDKDVDTIISNRPYSSIKEFMEKTEFKESKFEMLLFSNALSSFGDVETLYNWYHNEFCSNKKSDDNFEMFDFGDEFSENKELVTFTKRELEEKCFDMNGFFIDDNLLITMKDVFENKEKYLGEELSRNEKIYSIQEAINKVNESVENDIVEYLEDQNLTSVSQCDDIQMSEIEEIKKEKISTKWVLAKIKKVDQIKSKQGKLFSRTLITDGISYLEIFGSQSIHPHIKPGNIIVVPLSISGDGNIHFDSFKIDKKDIFLIEG